MSDEEKEALEILNNTEWDGFMITIKNLIEKQSKEIEHWKAGMKIVEKDKNNHIERLEKEIEILNKNMNLLREQNISYKQSIHGLKEMNKIINKKWEDKIKAKIEEIDRKIEFEQNEKVIIYLHKQKRVLQSLLKKE